MLLLRSPQAAIQKIFSGQSTPPKKRERSQLRFSERAAERRKESPLLKLLWIRKRLHRFRKRTSQSFIGSANTWKPRCFRTLNTRAIFSPAHRGKSVSAKHPDQRVLMRAAFDSN